jgi:Ca-activated chloride channel family protein
MHRPPCSLAGAVSGLFILIVPLAANSQLMRGKVVMEDGSAPNRTVGIERFCHDTGAQRETQADKKGDYLWVMQIDPLSDRSCVLRASLSGYDSTVIDVSSFNWSTNPNLPPLVLRQRAAGSSNEDANIFYQDGVPLAARNAWNNAQQLAQKKNWKAAERELRTAVQVAPKFTRGWNALGIACANQNKATEARDAFQHAVELDPKSLGAYLSVARESIEAKDWSTADKTAAALIKEDTKQRYPEIYLHQATARFYLKDLDGAESSARTGIRLDRKREVPRIEYALGVILEAKGDYAGAREHLAQYLALDSKPADAEQVRARMENLGKPRALSATGSQTGVLEPRLELPVTTSSSGTGEAWVPGGMKAMAAITQLDEPVTHFGFFSSYCRAIVREVSLGTTGERPQFIQTLRTYLAAVTEMAQLGERGEDGTKITLSLATDDRRKETERILRLLGWKLGQKGSAVTVEPGDQPEDGPRQAIPRALGIDEIRMQETLEAGREFSFEIPTENARLAGGEDWSALLKDAPVPPGGVAASFATDWRLAKTCAGLSAMSEDAAAALLTAADLRTLATRYADQLARHGAALNLSGGAVALPGGVEAAPVWQKLAGENPRNTGAFFRAILDKPFGTLAAYYSVLARSDAAHQRFFTKTTARAERFYAWYRQGEEFRNGQSRQVEGWRTEFLQKLPLDESGNVRYPGGNAAWTASAASGDEVLLSLPTLETLVPVAELELRRGRPFDANSVKLLTRHYSEWHSLFPYFERLTALRQEEFEALERFGAAVGEYPTARQNAVLGEWHSLMELISRGVQAGSIDQAAGAAAFRRTCQDLTAQDHQAKALAVLREISGGDTHEAVARSLLRLSEDRRAAFERMLKLQNVPPISGDPEALATALSGLVYAASLDPDGLLVNADPSLLRKHQFTSLDKQHDQRPAVFSPVALVPSASGAYLTGGLVNLEDLGKRFAPAGKSVVRSAPRVADSAADSGSRASSALNTAEPAAVEADFKVTGRLVEVYATVTDGRGRYVDNLNRGDFTILDQKNPQNITAFEPQSNEVSCVLLLDTTGSMQLALPALKNAALRLIGELRPEDSVAVYNFSDSVTELQPFTTDKAAAKRAVLHTQAFGETALYDALARVGQDLNGRAGKKVMVLFTDGKDNASTLNTDAAIQRAKANGVPIYTIAQGEAIGHRDLLEQLAGISKATGGEAFAIEKPSEIGRVFDKVSEDLTHGYLLSFQPPSSENPAWRPIQVTVSGPRGLKVRAREGYYPE